MAQIPRYNKFCRNCGRKHMKSGSHAKWCKECTDVIKDNKKNRKYQLLKIKRRYSEQR